MTIWEILVPCLFGDTRTAVRTKHHQEWDKVIEKASGGLTILSPAKGRWISPAGELIEDRVIPVRIGLSRNPCPLQAPLLPDHLKSLRSLNDEVDRAGDIMRKLATFTCRHYRQDAVMYYLISSHVHIIDHVGLSVDSDVSLRRDS